MAKLWDGRFTKTPDALLMELNASIPFDARLYKEDIQGSLVHSAMLEKQGILTKEEKDAIHQGLHEILEEIGTGTFTFDIAQEDIHTAVEQRLTQKTPAGKKLHTGRSRNDQVALDMRLHTRNEIKTIRQKLAFLMETVLQVAKAHTHTVMPGYTHLQRAQPITFAHALLAYAQMFKRDMKRLANTLDMLDECPLGAGALAGTTHPLDRHFTANELGFAGPMENSLDAVSDRDYLLELLSDLSILMMHLSRMSEELILWCSWEFGFIEFDDAYSTGSSIMPQKKNPDICELVRGKTGRTYGHLMALLTTLKGLPLAYNKDMQEDKEGVFDAIDTAKLCLDVFAPMLATMTVKPQNMEKAAAKGFINATDCADYLTKKGMPFRDAYKLTGQMVRDCIEKDRALTDIPAEELATWSPLFGPDFHEEISLLACVEKRNLTGGPAPVQVQKQMESLEAFLNAQDLH